MAKYSSQEISPDDLRIKIIEQSTKLHGFIENFDESNAEYEIAGPIGVALFKRDERDTISHSSSSPSPEIIPFLDELRSHHLDRVTQDSSIDNSHLPNLLVLCMFMNDPDTRARFDIDTFENRPTLVRAIDEEQGKHDPELEPLDVALRAWIPLAAKHMPEYGVHTAILEMVFTRQKYEKYVPW